MRIQIAICDDNKKDIEYIRGRIEKVLDSLGCEYDISVYYSGDELIRNIDEVASFDALFLDIDMPGSDGIMVADKLKAKDTLVNILFVTNRDDLVFDTIRFTPFRFIRKEKIEAELEEAITAMLTKLKDEMLLYDFGIGKDRLKIPVKDVIYLESKGHYITIYTNDKEYVVRGKISDYEKKLSSIGFVRIHIGYLVNIRSIYGITSKGVTLDSGEVLPISRKNTEKIKERHANYVRRFVRGIY